MGVVWVGHQESLPQVPELLQNGQPLALLQLYPRSLMEAITLANNRNRVHAVPSSGRFPCQVSHGRVELCERASFPDQHVFLSPANEVPPPGVRRQGLGLHDTAQDRYAAVRMRCPTEQRRQQHDKSNSISHHHHHCHKRHQQRRHTILQQQQAKVRCTKVRIEKH